MPDMAGTVTVRVPTLTPEGQRRACTLLYSPRLMYELTFEGEPLGKVTFVEADFVACLAALRERLEELGWRILCNGARIDAHASAMSRQGGGGLATYLLDEPPGEGARPRLFYLFGEAEPSRVTTVAEQSTYVTRRLFGAWADQREEWTPPLRKLRIEQAVTSGDTTMTLRSVTLHGTGMAVSFHLASPNGDVPPPIGRLYPRVGLHVSDDRQGIYQPTVRGAADGGVTNCGWVHYGLWDLRSWLRPALNSASRRLTLVVSDLRWAGWTSKPGELGTRKTQDGAWCFAIARPPEGWLPR
jgi:hypothetical protein